jgi:hypothetical protein
MTVDLEFVVKYQADIETSSHFSASQWIWNSLINTYQRKEVRALKITSIERCGLLQTIPKLLQGEVESSS